MSALKTVDAKRLAELVAVAKKAKANAYAPYSKFQVGAALLAVDGTVFSGANFENSAYPAGTCAERTALGTATTAGHRKFDAVVIVSSGSTPTTPCGICRQALAEFGLDLEVIAVTSDGADKRWRLRDLLPEAFTPESLK